MRFIFRTSPALPLPWRFGSKSYRRGRQQIKKLAASWPAKAKVLRAKQLRYAGQDPEYVALNNDISNLEKQLKRGGEIASLFNRLKEKLAVFTNRQSSQQHK